MAQRFLVSLVGSLPASGDWRDYRLNCYLALLELANNGISSISGSTNNYGFARNLLKEYTHGLYDSGY